MEIIVQNHRQYIFLIMKNTHKEGIKGGVTSVFYFAKDERLTFLRFFSRHSRIATLHYRGPSPWYICVQMFYLPLSASRRNNNFPRINQKSCTHVCCNPVMEQIPIRTLFFAPQDQINATQSFKTSAV